MGYLNLFAFIWRCTSYWACTGRGSCRVPCSLNHSRSWAPSVADRHWRFTMSFQAYFLSSSSWYRGVRPSHSFAALLYSLRIPILSASSVNMSDISIVLCTGSTTGCLSMKPANLVAVADCHTPRTSSNLSNSVWSGRTMSASSVTSSWTKPRETMKGILLIASSTTLGSPTDAGGLSRHFMCACGGGGTGKFGGGSTRFR